MEIFDVGPLELLLLFILMFVFMGPRDMQKAGKTLGRWLNRLVKSEFWQFMRNLWDAIFHLPRDLMREANLEDLKKQFDVNPALRDELEAKGILQRNRLAKDAMEHSIMPHNPSRSVSHSYAIPPFQSNTSRAGIIRRKKTTHTSMVEPVKKKRTNAQFF